MTAIVLHIREMTFKILQYTFNRPKLTHVQDNRCAV